MPEPGDHLGVCGVSEVEALQEGQHVGGMGRLSGVYIAPFGGVAKEWCVAQRWVGSPVPFSRVPWEILDEPCFENPVQGGLFTWCRWVLDNFEGCPGFLLGEYSNRVVVRRRDREGLLSRSLNATVGRDIFEFDHAGLVSGVFEH